MSAEIVVLIVVGLAVFFALGFSASSALRRRRNGPPVARATSAPELGLLEKEGAGDDLSGIQRLRMGYDGGIELSVEESTSAGGWDGSGSRTLARSSRIASELGRLGSLAASTATPGDRVFRVAVGGRQLMEAKGGGYRGVFVGAKKRIVGEPVLRPADGVANAAKVLGPQVVWAVAAFAVGQHFEAEIANRLKTIEGKLDLLATEMDRERIAELEAASRECERMALRLIDGVDPGEAVTGLSAQKQAIDKNWSLGIENLTVAEKRLSQLRSEGPLKASQLAATWEDLFGKDARFAKEIRLFLSALSAKMRLIALLAADEAASAQDGSPALAYQARLVQEMSECHQALARLQALLHEIVRLEYALDMSDWVPDQLQKKKTANWDRVLVTMRALLQLEDELEQLQLPFVSAQIFPDYELLARPNPDGSLELGLERAVVPVEVKIR